MYPETIIEHFKKVTGENPAVLVRAPGRINLIGEHTDYNEGFVLPAAIDKAVWFAAAPRSDDRLELMAHDLDNRYSTDLSALKKSGKGWPDYLMGVLDEAQHDGYRIGGVNLVFGGDIPSGSGLSSSAAVENGMIFVMNTLYGLGIPKLDMVRLAQRGENNFVGMQCGIMDMFASMMGQKDHAIRLDCRSLEYGYVPFHSTEYTLLLCNSGVKHALVDSEYNIRRKEAEEGVALLKEAYPAIHSLRDISPFMLLAEKKRLPELIFHRCKHVVEENERVEKACTALESGDWETLGDLLYQSHEGLQHEYEVICPEMDFLVDFTRKDPSILGARMMGGGFGGCTINLIRKDGMAAFKEKINEAYFQTFRIRPVFHEVALTDGVRLIT